MEKYYQEALETLKVDFEEFKNVDRILNNDEAYSLLQFLVDKQKPIKPVKNELLGKGLRYSYHCAKCGNLVHLDERYCHLCGQRLDWEDIKENE